MESSLSIVTVRYDGFYIHKHGEFDVNSKGKESALRESYLLYLFAVLISYVALDTGYVYYTGVRVLISLYMLHIPKLRRIIIVSSKIVYYILVFLPLFCDLV